MISISQNIPKICFLRDIYIRDLKTIDNIFNNKIKEEINENLSVNDKYNNTINKIKYNDIPPIFTDLNTWIKSTNLLCWNCNNNFTGPPKFIPKVIEPNINGKVSIGVEGNFCKWNCCMSYINDKYPKLIENNEKKRQIEYLYYLWHGKYPKIILPAPNKYLQKPYGGSSSKEEYYKKFDEIE